MRALILMMIVSLSTALASTVQAQQDRITGLTTEISGPISGRVTELDGTPVRDVEVHVASSAGQQVVRTNDDGRFHLDLQQLKGTKTVFVYGELRLTLEKLTETIYEGQEAVEIQEATLPKVMPKLKSDGLLIPAYSSAARAFDAWIRAWLILEIGPTGEVLRVKLINPPGHDLDDVAVHDAFRLRFEPARDAAGRAVTASVLWKYDWPPFGWMVRNRFSLEWLPREAAGVPCRTTETPRRADRDCPAPAVAAAVGLPWLTRGPAQPTVDVKAEPTSPSSPWYRSTQGWVISGVGVAMLATATYLLVSAHTLEQEAESASDVTRARKQDSARSRRLGGYLLGGFGVAVTGYGIVSFALHTDAQRNVSMTVAGRF